MRRVRGYQAMSIPDTTRSLAREIRIEMRSRVSFLLICLGFVAATRHEAVPRVRERPLRRLALQAIARPSIARRRDATRAPTHRLVGRARQLSTDLHKPHRMPHQIPARRVSKMRIDRINTPLRNRIGTLIPNLVEVFRDRQKPFNPDVGERSFPHPRINKIATIHHTRKRNHPRQSLAKRTAASSQNRKQIT